MKKLLLLILIASLVLVYVLVNAVKNEVAIPADYYAEYAETPAHYVEYQDLHRMPETNSYEIRCDTYEGFITYIPGERTLKADLNGEKIDMVQTVAASGVKYRGMVYDSSVVLWNRNNNWTLIIDNEAPIPCKILN